MDPDVAALCLPLSDGDPCGPDLDLSGDAQYLNFLAQVEGVLPTSFFSLEDGKPFDPSTIDLRSHLAEADRLYMRSRDIRLLVMRARLLVLNRDVAGFSVTLAAIAEWLEKFWDAVHPLPEGEKLTARRSTISALDLPTVIFPLQYAPLFEGRRIGPVTYRAWIIATGEVKSREGDGDASAAAISEALANADANVLADARKHIALLDRSVQRICQAFAGHGVAVLDTLPEQVRKSKQQQMRGSIRARPPSILLRVPRQITGKTRRSGLSPSRRSERPSRHWAPSPNIMPVRSLRVRCCLWCVRLIS